MLAGNPPKPCAQHQHQGGWKVPEGRKGGERQGKQGERETTEPQKSKKAVTHGDSHGKGLMEQTGKTKAKEVRGSEMVRWRTHRTGPLPFCPHPNISQKGESQRAGGEAKAAMPDVAAHLCLAR